ncbi:MAG: hypothetical protein E1N59_2899 [Puniceicoccaceae bacterium 5H]|nr:MAG: hypothetical protein E1N59_2899 [Puniceicoccaceae bacterium 5H]
MKKVSGRPRTWQLWIGPQRVVLTGGDVREQVAWEDEADPAARALELLRAHVARGDRVGVWLAPRSLMVVRWQPSRGERQPPAELLPLPAEQLHWSRRGPWLLITRRDGLERLRDGLTACGVWVERIEPLAARFLPGKATTQVVVARSVALDWTLLLAVDANGVRWENATPATEAERIAFFRRQLNPDAPDEIPLKAHDLSDLDGAAATTDWRSPESRAAYRTQVWRWPLRMAAGVLLAFALCQGAILWGWVQNRRAADRLWQATQPELDAVEAESAQLRQREMERDRLLRSFGGALQQQQRLQAVLAELDAALADFDDVHLTHWQAEPGGGYRFQGQMWSRIQRDAGEDAALAQRMQALIDRLRARLPVASVELDARQPARLAFTVQLEGAP